MTKGRTIVLRTLHGMYQEQALSPGKHLVVGRSIFKGKGKALANISKDQVVVFINSAGRAAIRAHENALHPTMILTRDSELMLYSPRALEHVPASASVQQGLPLEVELQQGDMLAFVGQSTVASDFVRVVSISEELVQSTATPEPTSFVSAVPHIAPKVTPATAPVKNSWRDKAALARGSHTTPAQPAPTTGPPTTVAPHPDDRRGRTLGTCFAAYVYEGHTLWLRFIDNAQGSRVWYPHPGVSPEEFRQIVEAPSFAKFYNRQESSPTIRSKRARNGQAKPDWERYFKL